MSKRKLKFKYHGKCTSCAGPIMDWRTSLAGVRINAARRRANLKGQVFEAMYDDLSGGEHLRVIELAVNFCAGACRTMADAEHRLGDEYESRVKRMWESFGGAKPSARGTVSGRFSCRVPNLAQPPRSDG